MQKYYKQLFITLILINITLIVSSQVINPTFSDSIEMRDIKNLAADIYVPDGGSGSQYPTIFIHTPYNRILYRYTGLPLGIKYDLQNSDYAFVIVDWRCFYGSSDACIVQPNRGEDGYDVIEWIAEQSWSDGKVGTWGPSALGKVQFQTAKENPPHMVCGVPLVAGPQFMYEEYFPGGVYRTEYIEQLDALGYGMSTILLANPIYNVTWQYMEAANFYPEEIYVPVLMIGGWYDHNTELMLDFFDAIRSSSPADVKDKHRLLMGPWAHGGFGAAQVGTAEQGELFYYEAEGWSDSLALMFFDYYLRDIGNGWDQTPFIKYFQTGENNWYEEDAWPPDDAGVQNFYFHKNEILNTGIPDNTTDYETIIYDPHDPSPTVGGATLQQGLGQGPYDQAPVVEARDDILKYTTGALTQDIIMKGKATVHLDISSDCLDTDFAVRLTDVYPDGRSMLLAEGIKRMRFRDGYTANDTSVMVPGEIYTVTVDLPDIANTFLAGHRIRVDITSSNYPRYDCNLNNGGEMYTAGDTVTATNNIYLNSTHTSYIELPLVNYTDAGDLSSEENTGFTVFPNPADEVVNLVIDNDRRTTIVTLFDIHGRMLTSMPVNHSSQIDVSGLEQGVYIIQYVAEDISGVCKLVVH